MSIVSDGFRLSPDNMLALFNAMKERVFVYQGGGGGASLEPLSDWLNSNTYFSYVNGYSPLTGLYGNNWSTQAIFAKYQYWLDAMGGGSGSTPFINDTIGDPSGTTMLPKWTLATWSAAAGLNSTSTGGQEFRRVSGVWDGASTPTFQYGFIQTGDILGYWIWEDLVLGLQRLNWTVMTGGGIGNPYRVGQTYNTTLYPTQAAADNAADSSISAWDGHTPYYT